MVAAGPFNPPQQERGDCNLKLSSHDKSSVTLSAFEHRVSDHLCAAWSDLQYKWGTCTFFLHLTISLFLKCPRLGLRIKETKEVYEGEVTELTPCETENPMGGYGKTISHVIIGLKTGKGTKQLKVRFEATGIYCIFIYIYIVCMYVVFPKTFCANFHSWTPAFTRVCRKNVWKLEM